MNEFSVVEYADIVYLYGYFDGNNDLQASREYHRRFTDRRQPSHRVFVIRNIFLSIKFKSDVVL
jgi:hypothetical protein